MTTAKRPVLRRATVDTNNARISVETDEVRATGTVRIAAATGERVRVLLRRAPGGYAPHPDDVTIDPDGADDVTDVVELHLTDNERIALVAALDGGNTFGASPVIVQQRLQIALLRMERARSGVRACAGLLPALRVMMDLDAHEHD
jgi:hypothetical protein